MPKNRVSKRSAAKNPVTEDVVKEPVTEDVAEDQAAERSATENPVEPEGHELFLEIRSQELSHRILVPLLRRLTTRLFEELMSRGIELKEILTCATPRRIALVIRGLPDQEPDGEDIFLGPPLEEAYLDDERERPSETLLELCKTHEVELDDLRETPTERGRFMAVVKTRDGRPIHPLISEMIHRHLGELTKSSDRGFGSDRWPRPVTGFCALLDGTPLDQAFEGLQAEAWTVGHLDDEPLPITGWDSWSEILAEQGIVPSYEDRRTLLKSKIRDLAAELGGKPVEHPGLLNRVAASCAVPTVIHGDIAPELLTLPEPLWVHTLAERQQAFAVRSETGLLPFFITVIDRAGDPEGKICRGYECAVAGHLADARFFYETDRKIPLARRVRRLEQLTFHERLGTWAEKSRRLKALVEPACRELGQPEILDSALEAAGLLKADLATSAVLELPELRGTMGGLYAREEGYVEAVWQAVHDQYQPRSTSDPIPRSRVGQVLAVADRLGSLVGFFGIGDGIPTQRHDPFKLRPLALGMLRILIEADMSLDLDLLSARALKLYEDRLDHSAEDLLKQLQQFLDDRLTHLLGVKGFKRDEIEAAKAVGTRDLPDLIARLEALQTVRQREAFNGLVRAAKRISKMTAGSPEAQLVPDSLTEPAELELHEKMTQVSESLAESISASDYEQALHHLLDLAPTLDRFFADVLVMDEDEGRRSNRLALLQACRRLYWKVARLNAMEESTWVESDSSTTT